MTYDRISMMAEGMRERLSGNRIVGLMLPRVSSCVSTWKEIESPGSWTPFETVYQAGPFLLPSFGNGLDLERRIDAVRVLRMLHAEGLVMALGCCALAGSVKAGSIVVIDDHVNCTGENPLRGSNDERLGPRYPDMSEPYDALWTRSLERGAASMGLGVQSAVYGRIDRTVTGDELGTWEKKTGIDVVGEGLLDEVIAAVHCGLPVAAAGIVEKSWTGDGNALCSSMPAPSEDYRRLAELINQCLLCRGGMDDG